MTSNTEHKGREPHVPTNEELERASHFLGMALSEVDWLESSFRQHVDAYSAPARDALLARMAGKDAEEAAAIGAADRPQPLTYEEVGRLFIFADDVALQARQLEAHAKAIRDVLATGFWEGHDVHGTPEVEDYGDWSRRRVADLRREADELEAAASKARS